MTPASEALDAFGVSGMWIAARDWPGRLEGLDQPGLYAWRVDVEGADHLSCGLGIELPAGLIYVGQAGAASSKAHTPSASTLGSRIGGNHLRGRVRGSTLRRTLASILLGPLALDVVGPRKLEQSSEARLGEWMREHLCVAVHPVHSGEHLAELEEEVVVARQPPLNLDHLPSNDLSRRLRDLRAIVMHCIDDLWRPPAPSLTDWRLILAEYGQAFDGYRYAAAVRRKCPGIAEDVWQRFREGGCFESSFAELRCALFWLQRCVRNDEQTPGWTANIGLQTDVQLLYSAIQETWLRQWGRAVRSEATFAQRGDV